MDIAVIGEGEQTFLELAQAYEENGLDEDKLSKIDGIAYRHNNNLEINPKRELIRPLIKFPSRQGTCYRCLQTTFICLLQGDAHTGAYFVLHRLSGTMHDFSQPSMGWMRLSSLSRNIKLNTLIYMTIYSSQTKKGSER